jgi:hypothetical protein
MSSWKSYGGINKFETKIIYLVNRYRFLKFPLFHHLLMTSCVKVIFLRLVIIDSIDFAQIASYG